MESATALNARGRLTEGLFLWKQQQRQKQLGHPQHQLVDPYSGALFHEPPLVLAAFASAKEFLQSSDLWMDCLWILMDVLTGLVAAGIAGRVAEAMLAKQERNRGEYHEDAKEDLLMARGDVELMRRYSLVCFLFNPYSLFNCASRTSTVLDNLLMASFLHSFVSKRRVAACFFLALASYKVV